MSRYIIKNDKARDACIEYIKSLPLEPTQAISIKPYVKKRSVDQNALYHMWVETFAQVTGYTHEEQHEVFKAMFLPIVERDVKGVKLRELGSTTKLNTKEFSDYMKEIEALAVEYGIMLPYPEELMYVLR